MNTFKKWCVAALLTVGSTCWAIEPVLDTEFGLLEPVTDTVHHYKDEPSLDQLVYHTVRNIDNWTVKDKLCLAKNIYHEAANEPLEGQVAVAVVTLNRALNDKFPDTICDVVYQRTTLTKRSLNSAKRTWQQLTWTVCQFTWTCLPVKPPKETDPRWQNILQLVELFSVGGFPHWREKYQHSYNYHAYYVNPRWNLKFLTRTGAHLFYRH